MHIKEKEEHGVVVLAIEGELSMDTVPDAKKVFKKISDRKIKKIIISFKKVEYIDSLGLASLIGFSKDVEPYAGTICFCEMSPKVSSIFKITKVDKAFKVFDSEKDAKSNI